VPWSTVQYIIRGIMSLTCFEQSGKCDCYGVKVRQRVSIGVIRVSLFGALEVKFQVSAGQIPTMQYIITRVSQM